MSEVDYEKINKYKVSIKSIKNKIKEANGIDELTVLASKIIELENQIVLEKNKDFLKLEKSKKEAELLVDQAKRKLKQAEYELQHLESTIELKTTKYRKELQLKIESLENDVVSVISNKEFEL